MRGGRTGNSREHDKGISRSESTGQSAEGDCLAGTLAQSRRNRDDTVARSRYPLRARWVGFLPLGDDLMQALLDRMGWVPRTCVWELTRACNLNCGHCGSMAGRPRHAELSREECFRVVEELAALGNRLITLSGGEPTLRGDWPEIAQHAKEHGILVNLVTNGQTDGQVLATHARAVGLTNVAVSLDGLESTHDALRGKGAFQRATSTIQTLTLAGIWVDVMVTVNQSNLAELEELHAYAARLGVKRFRGQLGKPMGN